MAICALSFPAGNAISRSLFLDLTPARKATNSLEAHILRDIYCLGSETHDNVDETEYLTNIVYIYLSITLYPL